MDSNSSYSVAAVTNMGSKYKHMEELHWILRECFDASA
jgi:hypothetical protein